MRIKKWLLNNIGLKMLSLVLAIITWFYISSELAKIREGEENAIISMLRYEVVSKKLPIQLSIVGEPRIGYEVIADSIAVEPETIVIVGPKNLLDDVDFARTVPVDISEYTKDVKMQISLAPLARGLVLKDDIVRVHIPIVRIEEDDAGKSTQ